MFRRAFAVEVDNWVRFPSVKGRQNVEASVFTSHPLSCEY